MSTILNIQDAYKKAPVGIELRTPEEVQSYRDNYDINVKFPYVWNVWASALAESGPDGYQFYVWEVYTHRPKENGVKPINYICRKDVTDFPLEGYGDDGLFYKRIACDDKRTCQTSYFRKTPIWWEYGDVKQVMTVWSSNPDFLPEFGYVDDIRGPFNLCGYFTDSSNKFLPIQNSNGEMVEGPSYPMVAIRQNRVINYGSKSRAEVWRYEVSKGVSSAVPYYAITINAFNIKNGGIKSPHEGSAGPTNRVGSITMPPGLNGLEGPFIDREPMMHTIQLVGASPSSPYEDSGYGYFYLCESGTNKKLLIDDNLGDQWIMHKDNFYKDQYELFEHVDVTEVDLSNKKAQNAKLLDICQTNGKYLKLYENASLVEGDQIDGYDKKYDIDTLRISNTLNDIYYSNNTWIAVGDSTTILRSTDNGLTWTKIKVSGISGNTLQGLHYSNNTWIAVGNSIILRSIDNGLTWSTVSGVSGVLRGIHYANNTWIAVGNSTTILRSTDDGLTWTNISVSNVSSNLYGIYYANNTWIIVGYTGTILRSTDNGLTWSKITSGVSGNLNNIHYANNTWIIVGSSGIILRSTDNGLTWSTITVSDNLYGIYYSNNTWIAVGDSTTIVRSTDNGLTWTKITSGITSHLNGIHYSNNTWIIVGSGTTILRSIDDGLTWTKIISGVSNGLCGISYSNNTWIIVGYSATILRSTDNGLTWTKITVNGVSSTLWDISYSNNTWILVGSSGVILRSIDNGLTWSNITVSGISGNTLQGLHYSNNTWIIIGDSGTILRSTDNGLTWTKITVSGVSTYLYGLHYSNNTWIIVGSGTTMLRSTDDGLTWTKIESGVSSNLRGIHYANNTWIAVGYSIILRSTDDGLTWSRITVSGVSGKLNNIYYSNNTWIAVGDSGTIVRSIDNGLSWTKITVSVVSDSLYGIYYSNNTWIIVGGNGTILRSTDNGLTWQFEAYNNASFNIFSDTLQMSNYIHSILYNKDGSLSNITTQAFGDIETVDYSKILDYKALDGFEVRAIETLDNPRVEFRFKDNTEFGWSGKYRYSQIGDNTWIAVGDSGLILRSINDGFTWDSISVSGVSSTLRSIAYGNNTWIISGDMTGTILRSIDNGLTWTKITISGINSGLNDVTYCNNVWFIVKDAALMLRSIDNGLTWTKVTLSGAGFTVHRVYYANNVLIGIGDMSAIRSTDNGLTWTNIYTTGLFPSTCNSIHYANNTWIITGSNGTILRSTDNGLSWTKISVSGVTVYILAVYCANNTWIAVGESDTILRSIDNGLTWTKITLNGLDSDLQSIYYSNNVWITVDNWGYIYKSIDDGLTWSKVYDSNNRYVFNSVTGRGVNYSPNQLTPYQMAEFSDPANLDNRYLAVPESYQIALFDPTSKSVNSINRYGLTSDNFNCLYARENDLVAVKSEMQYTDNGLTWTKITVSGVSNSLWGIYYSNNTWIIVGVSGTILRSTDNGLTWTKITVSGVTATLSNIYYANNTWIAVGYPSTTILRSTDNGLTWTKLTVSGVTGDLYSISYSNNTWIAVGAGPTIIRSTDNGLTWTKITVSGVGKQLRWIYYSNNTWIITGSVGTILRSTDNGLTWTSITVSGVSSDLYGIHYTNNTWITVGSYGTILRSTDNGLTWTKLTVSGVTGDLYSISYSNNTWIIGGNSGTILRSTDNGLTWTKLTVSGVTGVIGYLFSIHYANHTWIIVGQTGTILRSPSSTYLKFSTNVLSQASLIAKSATAKARNYSISIRDLNISGYETYIYNYGIIPIKNKSYSLFGYSMRVDSNLWHTRYYIINIEGQTIVWTNPNLICKTFMKPQSKFKMVNGELIIILDNDAAGASLPQIYYRIKLKTTKRIPLPAASPTTIGRYPEDHVFQDAFVDHDPQFVYEKSYTSANKSLNNRGSVPYDQIPVKIPGDPTKTYKKDRYLIPKPYMANIIEDMKDPYEYDNLPE